MEQSSAVEERIGKQLAFAAKAFQAHFDQALTGIGSSFHTYIVLKHVEMYAGVPQRELARNLGIENSTLTHHLDRLVTLGLVERVRGRDDRRTSSAALTAKGRAHVRKTARLADEMDASFRSLFSKQELATLRVGLQRIINHYGRPHVDDYASRTG